MDRTRQAKALRKNQTPTEAVLWQALRRKTFGGLRFRRQQQIGPYIVDFYCAKARLVIEVDGNVHASSHAQLADHKRQKTLENMGHRVLRFTTTDVNRHLEGVLLQIETALAKEGLIPLPLAPSRVGEGEFPQHHDRLRTGRGPS